jgi:hypothetical protein
MGNSYSTRTGTNLNPVRGIPRLIQLSIAANGFRRAQQFIQPGVQGNARVKLAESAKPYVFVDRVGVIGGEAIEDGHELVGS